MKTRLLSAAMCLALVLTLASQAAATETPSFTLDGTALQMEVAPMVVNRTTYVCYWPVVKAMYPDAVATWENDRAVVRAQGLELTIQIGAPYLVANGRYLYFEGGPLLQDGNIMVPIRTLAQALGAAVTWEKASGSVAIQSGFGPILSGDQYYNADSLYWLSHIIYAESGNQPLTGKIAVGNVVLNRTESGQFPDTVKEVVFDSQYAVQFTPVANGTIYQEPAASSVLAAKLCLEGAEVAGDSLYFFAPAVSAGSWITQNRTYYAAIGSHHFYR